MSCHSISTSRESKCCTTVVRMDCLIAPAMGSSAILNRPYRYVHCTGLTMNLLGTPLARIGVNSAPEMGINSSIYTPAPLLW